MGILEIEGVTHWSIPVNNLRESEHFYGDVLGLTPGGSTWVTPGCLALKPVDTIFY